MYRYNNPFRTKNSQPTPRPYNDKSADRPFSCGHVSVYVLFMSLILCLKSIIINHRNENILLVNGIIEPDLDE